MHKHVWLVLLACLSLAFAPAPRPKPKKKNDLDVLRGDWKVVRVEIGGSDLTERYLRFGMGVSITKGHWKFSRQGRPLAAEYAITLNPKNRPKTIDLKHTASGLVILGIYRLEKDTFKICYRPQRKGAVGRPTSFTGDGNALVMTLRREKR